MAAAVESCKTGSGGVVRVANMDPEKYPTTSFPSDPQSPMGERHDWTQYFQCGYKGAHDSLRAAAASPGEAASLNGCCLRAVVHGTVPNSAGLSSSSALVVASALTTHMALNVSNANASGEVVVARKALAEECCRCERYIGTMGGGMDQAISCLGKRGSAMKVSFLLSSFPVSTVILSFDIHFLASFSTSFCYLLFCDKPIKYKHFLVSGLLGD